VHELLNTRRTRIVHAIKPDAAIFALAQAESLHALHLSIGSEWPALLNIY